MSATTAQAYSGHDLVFDPELIRRFDVLGPRYTSYPTADRFSDDFGAEALSRHLGLRPLGGIERDLSLYFHIPFCNTVCYYCGCNKIVPKNRLAAARYIDYLGREMALQAQYLAGERKVAQMIDVVVGLHNSIPILNELRIHFGHIFKWPIGKFDNVGVAKMRIGREIGFGLCFHFVVFF